MTFLGGSFVLFYVRLFVGRYISMLYIILNWILEMQREDGFVDIYFIIC